MNRIVSGTVKTAGALAVAGGAILATAMPAGAVTLPRAWGAEATGTVSLPQVAVATTANTPATAFNVSAPPLLSTGFILDRAGPNTGYSSVQYPDVYISSALATVSATKVTSSCTTGISGTSNIYGGTVVQTTQSKITLPFSPAPDTKIKIPGGVTITLNKQNTLLGIRQVTAMYIAYSGQNLSLGVTRC
ncbi:MAG TPA: hypothetical protein VIK57_17650 [Streptosporangiaceae bacterium]